MNIDSLQFELRRRRLDEIFDFAVTVLRHHPLLFFTLAAPQILICLAINIALIAYLRTTLNEFDEFDGFWQNVFLLLVLLVEQSAIRLPLLLANGRLLFQKTVALREVWSDFRAVAIPYFWRMVVVRNLFLFVLWPRYFFLSEVLSLERSQGNRIRPRLENLTRRQSDRILGFRSIALMLGFLFLIVGLFFWSTFLEIPGLATDHWYFSDDFSFLTPMMHLLFLIYAVFHAVARFLFYIDTRSLLEGWDVEKMLLKGIRESTGNT